jgi:hypothetical protein
MRNSYDGWFKINGEKGVLEFADGEIVIMPFDTLTLLPMIHYFDDIDDAATKLKQVFIHASQKKRIQTYLELAKK